MTRLLFTSSSYPADPQDWKGRFIADMLAALAARPGLDVSVWMPPGILPAGVVDIATRDEHAWLAGLMATGGMAARLRRGGPAGLGGALGLLARLHRAYRRVDADLVHVNWLQNALPLWGTRLPALITVLGSDYGLLTRPGMVTALRGARTCGQWYWTVRAFPSVTAGSRRFLWKKAWPGCGTGCAGRREFPTGHLDLYRQLQRSGSDR
ncbi:MAG TPA: hypothetical protein PKH69_08980 [Thiobacillaceae bacterium]|nr:hypothetical protein [Thiobacillaceae bacterium]HNU64497.1 hypothetical protein [Thiobacillaceae bacterium]